MSEDMRASIARMNYLRNSCEKSESNSSRSYHVQVQVRQRLLRPWQLLVPVATVPRRWCD